MLKLLFIDDQVTVERLTGNLEIAIAMQVTVAIRAGDVLSIRPGAASLLIPIDFPGVAIIQPTVDLDRVDADFLEATLRGTWLTSQTDAGVFYTSYPDPVESAIIEAWRHLYQPSHPVR